MRVKQILIVATAIFMLSSCLKGSDPIFQIEANVILFQEIQLPTPNETSGDTVYTYTSYIQVWSNDVMLSCSCMHPLIGNITLSKIDDSYWRSTFPMGTQISSIPTGSFVITATSINQSEVSDVVSITTSTEGMSNKLESMLSYDPVTREVTATFNTVTDATLYGIYIIQGDYFLISEVKSYTAEQMQIANGSVRVELPEVIEEYAGGEYYLVTYVAKIVDTPIVQLGTKTLITK
jgi:hypothetical protein